MILKVTYNDSYHLRALEIKETGSLAGLGEPPQGSTVEEEGQGKAGSREHCGPVQLRCSVLGRWVLHSFLPGLAGIELAQCRH